MSYDLNVRTAPCDHSQLLERYFVDGIDFRTLHLAANPGLNMRAPLNGKALVKLYIGGVQVAPDHPIYGYDMLPDTNRINTPDLFYKIVFKNPVRFFIPLIEVSYITVAGLCLKCGGTSQLNDLKKANSGGVLHVIGIDKLTQKVLKFVLSSSCPFYPQLVCQIKNFISRKLVGGVSEDDVSVEIINALQNLKNIQSAQSTIQVLTPGETLKDVANVATSMPDPTSIAVQASIISYAGSTPQPVNFSLTSTYSLVGQ